MVQRARIVINKQMKVNLACFAVHFEISAGAFNIFGVGRYIEKYKNDY